MSRRRSSDARRSPIVKSTRVSQAQPSGERAGDPGGEAEHASAPAVEDLRDLEAPQPLERILIATAKLAPGEAYSARVPRYPRLLLPRLEERGLLYEVVEEPDGTALVHIRRPT
jgi:hypothetical protein